MKKVVRILGLCALMTFAFTACNKNNDGKIAIKAGMPETTSDSKTYLDGDWVKWSNYDEILVVDKQSTEIEDHVWLEVGAGQHTKTATFYGDINFFSHLETDDNSYTAFYPVASETSIKTDSVYVVIPEVQTFVENSFAANTYPMYASNVGKHFAFESPAGLLTIPIKATTSPVTITSILLSVGTAGNPVVGTLKYHKELLDGSDTDLFPDYELGSISRSVTLQCPGSGYTIPQGEIVDFNFILLEGALQGTNKFTMLLNGEGNGFIGLFAGQINNHDFGIVRQTRATMEVLELPL